jgi:adenine-specific DNA methylase
VYQEDIILDPFGGTGTTAFVAKKHNRKFIHIDISKDYNKVAIENNIMKTVLYPMSGEARPGELLGVMGTSGAGIV